MQFLNTGRILADLLESGGPPHIYNEMEKASEQRSLIPLSSRPPDWVESNFFRGKSIQSYASRLAQANFRSGPLRMDRPAPPKWLGSSFLYEVEFIVPCFYCRHRPITDLANYASNLGTSGL